MSEYKITVKDDLIVTDNVKNIKKNNNEEETIIPESIIDVDGLDYVD